MDERQEAELIEIMGLNYEKLFKRLILESIQNIDALLAEKELSPKEMAERILDLLEKYSKRNHKTFKQLNYSIAKGFFLPLIRT